METVTAGVSPVVLADTDNRGSYAGGKAFEAALIAHGDASSQRFISKAGMGTDNLVAFSGTKDGQQQIHAEVLREGQENLRETVKQAKDVVREVMEGKFEALKGQMTLLDRIKDDGEKTRELIRAQDAARKDALITELQIKLAAVCGPGSFAK
jgi:hypothetical protein